MATIANLLIKIGADIENLKKGMTEAQNKVNKTADAFKKAGTVMTMGVTAPILAAGAASFKMASDVAESVNKVEVAFQKNADEVQAWAKTTLSSIGLAEGTALDMAANYGDMATAMGKTTAQAAKMSIEMVNLAGDMASFKNIDIAQASTALTAIFTGETESLKRLGIVMTETNLQAYALSRGIQENIADMDQATKVQLRYEYVMEMTKNSQGDFARTQEGAANQMRMFTEGIKELGASLGEQLLPIITPIIAKLNSMVQTFAALDDEQKRTILTIAGIAAAIGPLLIAIGSAIKSIAAIKGALAVLTATQTATTAATAGLNTAMLANPYVLVTVAVLALIAALAVLLIKSKEVSKETRRAIDEEQARIAEKGEAERLEIERTYQALKDAVQKKIDLETEYYETVKAEAQKAYDEDLELGRKQLSQMREELQERKDLLREEYDLKIDAINEEYRALEEAERAKTKQYNERMKQYEAEYLAKIGIINAGLDAELAGYQSQIDSINGLTEAENKAIKERADAQKIADLQDKLNHSYTLADKAKAQEELNAEIARQERERLLAERQEAIASLKLKMEEAIKIATEEKEKLETEFNSRMETEKQAIKDNADYQIAELERIRKAKEKEEKAKYKAALKTLEDEKSALGTWLEDVYKPMIQEKLDIALEAEKTRHEQVMANYQAEADALAEAEKKAVDEANKANQIEQAQAALKILEDELKKLYEQAAQIQESARGGSGAAMGAAIRMLPIQNQIEALNEAISEQVAIIRALQGDTSAILGNTPTNRARKLPEYAQGTPYVPENGLAYLHKGEAVIPAGQNSNGPAIIINATYNVPNKEVAEYANNNLVSVLQARGISGGYR